MKKMSTTPEQLVEPGASQAQPTMAQRVYREHPKLHAEVTLALEYLRDHRLGQQPNLDDDEVLAGYTVALAGAGVQPGMLSQVMPRVLQTCEFFPRAATLVRLCEHLVAAHRAELDWKRTRQAALPERQLTAEERAAHVAELKQWRAERHKHSRLMQAMYDEQGEALNGLQQAAIACQQRAADNAARPRRRRASQPVG